MDMDIAEAARATGVTSRTLRHYDAIGLLTPTTVGRDGRRRYGEAELVRLQHILVLRALGTPLETIAAIVDTDDPVLTAALLREHHVALLAERDRYAALAATVERTIHHLETGDPMSTDDLFEGFDHVRYEPEARERWGDAAVDSSNETWRALGPDGQRRHLAEHEAIAAGLGAAAAQGADPASDAVQELIARHHAWVSTFWTPGAEAYRALGAMYVGDHRFRATYDKHGDGTAELLRAGIEVYADRLSQ